MYVVVNKFSLHVFFFGKTAGIGYAKSQGSTKLTVTAQFVLIVAHIIVVKCCCQQI